MKKKIKLTESNLIKLIKYLVEQEESEEYYKITPQEYKKYLENVNNKAQIVPKLKVFGGKPLWITGDLNVSGLPIDDLGNIARIDGRLDISNTKIADVSQIDVKRYVSDYGSKRDKLRQAAELRQKRAEAAERRENDEWNPEDTDDVGLRANALFEWLVSERELETISDEEKEELLTLRQELETLQDREDSESDEVVDRISEIEDRIDEIESEGTDVYELVVKGGYFVGLTVFEVLSLGEREYSVGTESEMDEAAEEYVEDLIDDIGIDGFRKSFVEGYIDEDYLKDYVYNFYYDDVVQNPEVYFNDGDFELTEEQEARKEQLETYISDMEDMKTELEDKQKELEDSDSDEYYELQEKIDEIEENIDTAQEELDSIEPDNEPTDEMIEDKVNDYVRDRVSDPIDFINEFGLELEDFIDKKALIKGYIESDDYGQILNKYDGTYDTIEFNDEIYYIMRIN